MRIKAFTFILLFAAVVATNAQTAQTSLEQCTSLTDTMQVLQNRFNNHKEQWIGKKVKVVYEAFAQMLPILYTADIETSPYVDPDAKSYVQGVALFPTDRDENLRRMKRKKPLICFDIYFNEINITVYDFYHSIPDEVCGAGILRYMGDYTVKDLKVYVLEY